MVTWSSSYCINIRNSDRNREKTRLPTFEKGSPVQDSCLVHHTFMNAVTFINPNRADENLISLATSNDFLSFTLLPGLRSNNQDKLGISDVIIGETL